ncbi:hypothetical protein [Pararobbsia silviterrae]|uniref:Uncharacterized protein n=1 Tax=Pararobbsia silviterrae TaxID=1792498 RepID=A0A494Y0Q1_9BURK|nr:hypothetical protein [Pararobbsia silviterrae]RKP56357.1 hypothetical protein D7S86_08130 [Pararobbsia silviterrae]
MSSSYPYFGFTAPAGLQSSGGTPSASDMSALLNPMTQQLGNSGSGLTYGSQFMSPSAQSSNSNSLPLAMLAMRQMGNAGQRTSTPQSTASQLSSVMPMMALMGSNPQMQQGLSSLGTSLGGLLGGS